MDEWPSRKPEEEESVTPERSRLLAFEISSATLTKRAAQLGTVAGEAVSLLRDVRRRLQEPGQKRDDRLGQIEATAQARITNLRRRADRWRQAAQEKAVELQRQARTGYEKARSRSRGVVHDYPVQVVLGAGVAGFVLGAAVRAWRAKRAG